MPTQIKVEFLGLLREITSVNQVVLKVQDQATLGQAIENLTERFGEKFRQRVMEGESIAEDVIVVLNGRSIRHSEARSVRLKEGDKIILMPESAP